MHEDRSKKIYRFESFVNEKDKTPALCPLISKAFVT